MLSDYDCVVVSTDHDAFDWKMIETNAKIIIDSRGRYQADDEHIYRA
jgi:UDP-N-acetyl-D-glucosamine dehydrogenase